MDQLQINYNLVPTTNNNTLAVVHWFDGKKYRIDCRVSPSKSVLITYIDNKKKAIILELLNNYINHRDYALITQITETTQAKINAIHRIKHMMAVYKKSSLHKFCEIIPALEQDLLLLMPGQQSKFFNHFNTTINQLLTFCKNQTNEQHIKTY
ncbi:hypothetical protein [Seonamhaeicola sp.]|uniref:hypothetical protein n=1 Tax=Seonamhaeicola sp. TaxID=1912245 RepID=UPI003568E749